MRIASIRTEVEERRKDKLDVEKESAKNTKSICPFCPLVSIFKG